VSVRIEKIGENNSVFSLESIMTPEQKQLIKSHADATCSRQRFAIAEILYDDCNPESLKTLEDIEITVKDLVLSHVTPQIGFFHRSN
jgi:hypothetical protein